jgi:hypothetical protein
MVDVADGANVYMGFVSFKLLLSHLKILLIHVRLQSGHCETIISNVYSTVFQLENQSPFPNLVQGFSKGQLGFTRVSTIFSAMLLGISS